MGKNCRFKGSPVVNIGKRSEIVLGDNVLVNSRVTSNPIGQPHPTLLTALRPGSFIRVGDGSSMSGASIFAQSGITIGDRVLVGAGACIWDTDFHPVDPQRRREHISRDARSKPIVIEDDVFIGGRALVLKGVTLGRGSVVGAGAVVTKDVGPGNIVGGNPARVIGAISSQRNHAPA
jgi:acetyltransferase-like isoleucine patch superfamily enzyme